LPGLALLAERDHVGRFLRLKSIKYKAGSGNRRVLPVRPELLGNEQLLDKSLLHLGFGKIFCHGGERLLADVSAWPITFPCLNMVGLP